MENEARAEYTELPHDVTRHTDMHSAHGATQRVAVSAPLQHAEGDSSERLQKCPICSSYIRNRFQQGRLCTSCGVRLQQVCPVFGSMSPTSSDINSRTQATLSLIPDCKFSRPLEEQCSCDEVPAVVRRCTREIEQRADSNALNLYDVYKLPVSTDEAEEFCKTLLEASDISTVNLDGFDINCFVAFLKNYLRELPEPVIPSTCYDAFIRAASISRSEERETAILTQMSLLPVHHQRLLHHVMSHVCKVCVHQSEFGHWEPPTALFHIFCHLLMRPPWHKIADIVENTEHHMNILECLLYAGDWTITMPTFTGENSKRTLLNPVEQLDSCPFYWKGLSRGDTFEKLSNQPDGSFLLRDSSSRGDYTLALRVNGFTKLLRIHQRNGRYSLATKPSFQSVPGLIEYYRRHSLLEFNQHLDLTLSLPLCTTSHDVCLTKGEALWSGLRQTNTNLSSQLLDHNQVIEKQKQLFKELDVKKCALEAANEMERILRKQLDRYDELLGREQENTEAGACKESILSSLNEITKSRRTLEEHKHKHVLTLHKYTSTLSSAKRMVRDLMAKREMFRVRLMSEGAAVNEVERCIDEVATYDFVSRDDPLVPPRSATCSSHTASHEEKSSWFVEPCSRQEAEGLLLGRKDGTFLIRPSSRDGQFALSIVAGGRTGHCVIFHQSTGFGFAAPLCHFESLTKLVLHYRTTSLADHNEQLDVTLQYPVNLASK